MEWIIFPAVVVAVVAGGLWAKRYFRYEIDRAKRIDRANKSK